MAKKPRSQRRRKNNSKGGDSGDGNSDVGGADYLSESHTIATIHSAASSLTGLGGDDDPDWDIDDDWDGKTNNDNESLQAAAESRQTQLVDALVAVEDLTSEKRTAKREQLLKGCFKALTQYATSPPYEDVWDRRETLLAACRHSIRYGSPSEQYAACRVLEATATLIGDEGLYEDLKGHLTRIVTSSHRAVPVRIAALRVMGMIVFIGVDEDSVTESVMDICEDMAKPEYRGDTVPTALRAAALNVWNLLATTVHYLYVSGRDDVSTGRGLLLLPLLQDSLEQSADLALRAAAGECIAWIHTARLELGILDTEDETSMYNTTQKQYQQGSWEGSEWEDTMAEIEQTMDELSNQTGHYMSKKAKKEQRAYFRDYLATLQDNQAPEQVVQFRGGSLELTSWKEIIALNFIRRCLQGGFQIQLLTNPTLQAIFGADGSTLNESGNMSQLEKRWYLSKTSEAAKSKDMDLTKKRDKRNNIKNHFLTADGEGM